MRITVIILLLTGICLSAILCTSREDKRVVRDAYGQAFAGAATCQRCHPDIYQSHIRTRHYADSRPATKGTIRGSFDSGRNSFVYSPAVKVLMQSDEGRFFQTAYQDDTVVHSEPFDIVIGSGRKGQSYLYWQGRALFQLPVSYFTPTDSWCKSPGYAADSPVYSRQVPAQCLECHATHAETVTGGKDEKGYLFDKDHVLYGVDCERCHGPGADHVAFHQAHPEEKKARYILNAARMTRQQRLDACALCHSGSRYLLKPAFSFRVGDKLDEFSQAKYAAMDAATLDVHGNQYGLLTSSRCFKNSQLDCSTCHNVHTNESGNLRLFSQRCMNCHKGVTHKEVVPADNCIDCHMPALSSQKITLQLSARLDTGVVLANRVRTHRIAIYKP